MKNPAEAFETNFQDRTPTVAQEVKTAHVRGEAKLLAWAIQAHCPDGREKALAMTKLEETMMWAAAAIARNQ